MEGDAGFGRLVAEVRGKSMLGATIFLAVMFGAMGLAILGGARGALRLAGLLPLGGAAYVVALTRARAGARVAVHERGVRVTLERETDVPIDALRSFRWKVTEVRVNGGYNHTVGELRIARSTGPDLVWQRNVDRDAAGFTGVRAALTRAVVARMREELRAAGRVPWVPGAALTPDALELDGGFAGGRAVTRTVPIRALVPELREGACALRADGGRELVATFDSGGPNFFPGLALLEELRRRP